ncbi:endonuclease [Thalassococcus sp. CAU 1522]|uniref:Endonuclease n=1 Tax=Thalassococcus arenae TaxID=2851652 RepID=A0ABS6N973_9RHOB|nr:endonuclease [Thalassococcus arenae]MBV2360563.1 endonuclease [Thalassococcus arenae]
MTDNKGGMSCALGCWALAAGVGLLTAILLLVVGGMKFFAAVFLGGLAFVLLGLLFNWMFCAPLPKPGEVKPGEDRGMRAVPPAQASAQASASGGAAAAKAPASAPASSPAKATAAAAAPAAASAVKPSKALSGQDDLAGRKGSWKYEGEGGAAKSAKKAPAKKAAAKKAPAKKAEPAAAVDYDGDGTLEGAGEGTRPEALSAPRGGKADDLKKIKGIGPKLEKLCNSLGFYHFDQIANWTPDEVAWVNANLEGFKGRVSRDEWVDQAKLLAAGGETAFSKKVDKGDVY